MRKHAVFRQGGSTNEGIQRVAKTNSFRRIDFEGIEIVAPEKVLLRRQVALNGQEFGVQVSDRYQRRPSPVLATLAVLGIYLLSLAAGVPHH
jgi:hypothetical protein